VRYVEVATPLGSPAYNKIDFGDHIPTPSADLLTNYGQYDAVMDEIVIARIVADDLKIYTFGSSLAPFKAGIRIAHGYDGQGAVRFS